MTLTERYDKLCATPSSINEHLPTLRAYASRCESVAEFGVDIGQSTTAFLMAQPKILTSYDLVQRPELEELFSTASVCERTEQWIRCQIGSTWWWFEKRDSRTCRIAPPVDLLFIDSAHCYDQLITELTRHHAQVKRWLVLHDTVAYGEYGEAGPPQPGLTPAIDEFLAHHPEWVRFEQFSNNNGLLILERMNG